jgi:cysteinyl-tRNA synthetase
MFPHHENEIAQSEALTGKPFARFWMHARFLLVEGEKMSKSSGNFFTPRDLILKGYKPSSIRYLLTSVPYRNQLNFTFSGLQQAAASVERLRNFRQRLTESRFPGGEDAALRKLAEETSTRMRAALEDDLNTAQAQAAIFEMVRAANVAMDGREMRKGNALPFLTVLGQFDEIFAVLHDDDAAKMRRIIEWAQASGRSDISQEALAAAGASGPSDDQVAAKIAEMEQARKAKNFALSDKLRTDLAADGIVVEITKDGIRWKRK